ncbi:T cell receptor alpha chain MC.7.G5-like [Garra rufa]|uniref:T cell receptor alpha chain MC.7.G5-like n=1 Tax=Garra rufa TaxID=137080 RepID=UPI003CCED2AD
MVFSLWVLGLFTAVQSSQTVKLSAQPGENVTVWCPHTTKTGKNIHWFKQTNSSVPIAIVYMMITYQFKVLHKSYLNGFRQDRMLMSLNTENTSLTILNVDIYDSGLYYCGWDSIIMTFGDGTQLDIKERAVTPLQNETEIANKDLKPSPISTRECSENIFYKLTFIFGGIVILIIILLTTLIIKIQRRNTQENDADHHVTQHHEEPYSSVYAALQFSKHQKKSRRAARNTEDTDVVYSATR